MAKYQVRVTETERVVRMRTFDAASVEDARLQAVAQDWRTWDTLTKDADADITDIQRIDRPRRKR